MLFILYYVCMYIFTYVYLYFPNDLHNFQIFFNRQKVTHPHTQLNNSQINNICFKMFTNATTYVFYLRFWDIIKKSQQLHQLNIFERKAYELKIEKNILSSKLNRGSFATKDINLRIQLTQSKHRVTTIQAHWNASWRQ